MLHIIMGLKNLNHIKLYNSNVVDDYDDGMQDNMRGFPHSYFLFQNHRAESGHGNGNGDRKQKQQNKQPSIYFYVYNVTFFFYDRLIVCNMYYVHTARKE